MAVNWVPIWVPIWPWKLLRFDLWPHWNPMWTYDESRQKGNLPSSSMKDRMVHPWAETIFRRWWVLRKPSKPTQNVPELEKLGNVTGFFPIINRDHGKYMFPGIFSWKKQSNEYFNTQNPWVSSSSAMKFRAVISSAAGGAPVQESCFGDFGRSSWGDFNRDHGLNMAEASKIEVLAIR